MMTPLGAKAMRELPEIPDSIDEVLQLMLEFSGNCVTAVRYYHYDHVARILSSAFARGGTHRGLFSPRRLVRKQNPENELDEAFAAIRFNRPVIVTVDSDLDITLVNRQPDITDTFLRFYVHKDPCPELAVSGGRRWFDIAVQTGGLRRQVVGKLSCSLKSGASDEEIDQAIHVIGICAKKYAAFIECNYLRTLYLPLQEIESVLSQCTSVPELVTGFVTEVSRRLPGTQATIALFQEDQLNVKQLSVIHSRDRYLGNDWSSTWREREKEINTEEDLFRWVAERKRPLALDITQQWAVASEEDDLLQLPQGFRLRNGSFGSLMLLPMIIKDVLLGIVSLRRCDSIEGAFSDSETLMLNRLCTSALPQRLIALRNEDTSRVTGAIDEGILPFQLNREFGAETHSGAYRELIQSFGASLQRIFPEDFHRHGFVVNLLTPGGDAFRHHYFGGTLADGALRDGSLPLSESFTQMLLESEEEVAILNDVSLAAQKQVYHPRYLDATTAIGVRIAFNGRPYGVFAVLSDRADLHFHLYAPRLRILGAQAGAILAHREVLDCSFQGLKNDVAMVARSVQRKSDLSKATRSLLWFAVSIVQSCGELTRMERYLPASECQPVNVAAEIDVIRQIVEDVEVVNSLEPSLIGLMQPTIVRMLIYKIFVAMRCEPGARVTITGSLEAGYCCLTFQIDGANVYKRIRDAMDLPLVQQLTGNRKFRNSWMAGLRLAQSLVIQHALSDGREGVLKVEEISAKSCRLIAHIPCRRTDQDS